MSLFLTPPTHTQFNPQHTAHTRKGFKVWHVFKQCKHNSILRTVESTLNAEQTETAREHDTKSRPAAQPATTTSELLSLPHSSAPSSLIKSVSPTAALPEQKPRVGKHPLYGCVLGKSEITSSEVRGWSKWKQISHILHLSEQLPPHRSWLPVWDPGGKAFCRLILRTSAWEGRNLKPHSDHFLICCGQPRSSILFKPGLPRLGMLSKQGPGTLHALAGSPSSSSSHSPWHISDAAQPGCLQEGNDIRSGSSAKKNGAKK